MAEFYNFLNTCTCHSVGGKSQNFVKLFLLGKKNEDITVDLHL